MKQAELFDGIDGITAVMFYIVTPDGEGQYKWAHV